MARHQVDRSAAYAARGRLGGRAKDAGFPALEQANAFEWAKVWVAECVFLGVDAEWMQQLAALTSRQPGDLQHMLKVPRAGEVYGHHTRSNQSVVVTKVVATHVEFVELTTGERRTLPREGFDQVFIRAEESDA